MAAKLEAAHEQLTQCNRLRRSAAARLQAIRELRKQAAHQLQANDVDRAHSTLNALTKELGKLQACITRMTRILASHE